MSADRKLATKVARRAKRPNTEAHEQGGTSRIRRPFIEAGQGRRVGPGAPRGAEEAEEKGGPIDLEAGTGPRISA